MKKTMIAGLLSAAVALSGFTATTARADDRDVARALAAIAAVAIIGTAIRNSNGTGQTQPASHNRLERLPSECVIETWGRRGPDHALGARCVERQMRTAYRLPNSCRVEVEVLPWQNRGQGRGHGNRHDRFREAYDIGCLYRAGYRFDRDR